MIFTSALLRVSGSIQKSTEVMQAMQRLVNVPEVAATMREMSKEMMRAGIMEEMIEETMESIEPDMDDMEEQAQEEIDKVSEMKLIKYSTTLDTYLSLNTITVLQG